MKASSPPPPTPTLQGEAALLSAASGRLPLTSPTLWLRLGIASVAVLGLLVLLDRTLGVIQAPDSTAPLTPLSLLPPLVAVAVALAAGRAVLALGLAVVSAALVASFRVVRATPLAEGAEGRTSFVERLMSFFSEALADTANLSVLLFAVLVMGLVHLLTRTGALAAMTDRLVRRVTSRRGAMLAPSIMGTALFFDDYANAMVVGASSRPLARRFGVSREKLAWIVDSTSAPVAGLVVVSTWIAFELTLLDAQRESFASVAATSWDFFIELLPYRLYCLFALALVYLVAISGRDFGPMLRAERRARAEHLEARARAAAGDPNGTAEASAAIAPHPHGPGASPTPARPAPSVRPWHALLPLGLVVLGGFFGATLGLGLESLDWLLIGALAGALVGVSIVSISKQLPPRAILAAFGIGAREILPIVAILVFAFALRAGSDAVGTDAYLAALCADLPAPALPIATFAIAALIAFATGTSWGTMALLVPTILPLAASLAPPTADGPILIALSAAAILDGAIFGDHCSLISDTTLISSMATGCPVIDHFRTQVPYAVLAMTCAAVFGYLGLALFPQLPVLFAWLAGFGAMTAFLFLVGRRP